MNSFTWLGNLTKDVEVRYSNNNLAIGRGTLAVNNGKDKDGNARPATFLNFTVFGKQAELLEKYGHKGRKFLLNGHIANANYEKDGKTVYKDEYIVDVIEFADSANNSNNNAPAPAAPAEVDGFMNIPEGFDEALPFI